MKKIFQVIAMTAAASMFAGCVCSKNCDNAEGRMAVEEIAEQQQAAIRADIQKEIEAIKQTVEVQQCQYENDTVKKLFLEIPFLNQQKMIKTLDMVLEANDGSVQYQLQLQREGFAKVTTKKQNKLESVFILDGRTGYLSKDGIEFSKQSGGNTIALYAMMLDFQRNAKKVALTHGKAYHFDGKKNNKVVDEALEVSVIKNSARSNQIKAQIATRDFTANTVFSYTADALRLPQQLDVAIGQAIYKINFDHFVTVSAKGVKDLIQPTAITFQAPGAKKAVAFTVKKFQVNVPFKENEFKPAIVIKPAPVVKKAAPVKKVEPVKKAEPAKKAAPAKGK